MNEMEFFNIEKDSDLLASAGWWEDFKKRKGYFKDPMGYRCGEDTSQPPKPSTQTK